MSQRLPPPSAAIEPDVVLPALGEGEARVDRSQRADRVVADQIRATRAISGSCRYMNAFGDDALAGARDGLDAIDVVGAQRQRLFAQHVLAGVERAQRPLDVQRVGQRNVDGVDRRSRAAARRSRRARPGCSTRGRRRRRATASRLATAATIDRRAARIAGISRR